MPSRTRLTSLSGMTWWFYPHTECYIPYMCMLSHFSCVWLCDPMDFSLPGSSVHGILQARMLEWVAISSSKGIFPTQGWNPCLPVSPILLVDSLPLSPCGSPIFSICKGKRIYLLIPYSYCALTSIAVVVWVGVSFLLSVCHSNY